MEKFLVCDGGGSKTDFIVFDKTGKVYSYIQKKGTNAIFVGEKNAAEAVCGGMLECISMAGCDLQDISRISLFIPGFKKCYEMVKQELKRPDIYLLGDQYNALHTALGNPYGIVVVSGTGSFAIGRDHKKKMVSCGGWGPLFGDKGSGYHIGVLCLEEITRLYDSGFCNTILQKLCLKAMNIESIEEIRRVSYHSDFTRDKIASLCEIVAQAAQQGDVFANQILDVAADELARLAKMVSQQMESSGLPVSLTGGVSKIGTAFTDLFRKKINLCCPQCTYQPAKYTPVVGSALYLLYEQVGETGDSNPIASNLMKYKSGR